MSAHLFSYSLCNSGSRAFLPLSLSHSFSQAAAVAMCNDGAFSNYIFLCGGAPTLLRRRKKRKRRKKTSFFRTTLPMHTYDIAIARDLYILMQSRKRAHNPKIFFSFSFQPVLLLLLHSNSRAANSIHEKRLTATTAPYTQL